MITWASHSRHIATMAAKLDPTAIVAIARLRRVLAPSFAHRHVLTCIAQALLLSRCNTKESCVPGNALPLRQAANVVKRSYRVFVRVRKLRMAMSIKKICGSVWQVPKKQLSSTTQPESGSAPSFSAPIAFFEVSKLTAIFDSAGAFLFSPSPFITSGHLSFAPNHCSRCVSRIPKRFTSASHEPFHPRSSHPLIYLSVPLFSSIFSPSRENH